MSDNNTAKDLVIIEPRQLTTRPSPMDALAAMSDAEFDQRLDSLKVAQKRMQRIQREIMTPDVDYGVIPGTGSKPTLLKPGAEGLCKFHRLVPTFAYETILGDGVTRPHIRVLTKCSLHFEAEDGPIVGQGMGAANSWEKKYRWREGQRKCPQCGAAAIIKGKADFGGGYICWAKKGGCGAKFVEGDPAITEQQLGQIENPDPFDAENTYVKMAAKRAYVDATLRATATSGLFSQDLEDMADEPEPRPATKPTNAQPAQARPRPEPPKPAPRATEPTQSNGSAERCMPSQIEAIYRIARDKHGWTEEQTTQEIMARFGVNPPLLSKKDAAGLIREYQAQTQSHSGADQEQAALALEGE